MMFFIKKSSVKRTVDELMSEVGVLAVLGQEDIGRLRFYVIAFFTCQEMLCSMRIRI